MAFGKVYSGAIVGLDSHLVEVEVNIDYQGFPGFMVVGLPAKEIDEAKERVRSAIKNSGYQFPNRRITVNMAPADLPKRGSFYDLPIAVGILKASGCISASLNDYFFIGELSLNGGLNAVSSTIPLTLFAKDNFKCVFLPRSNADEVSVIKGIDIRGVKNLKQLVNHLCEEEKIPKVLPKSLGELIKLHKRGRFNHTDFKHIKGQEGVKRALEIAAAGGHNISITGPPGAGKTLMAKALISILPALTEDEAIEVTKIYSIAGKLKSDSPFVVKRPFRCPHHSISKAGLLGGGNPITPGEISLAHYGVLFLDEFPELGRELIESLRQPLENGEITLSRAQGAVTYPSDFMLVVASNPCPCGNLGHPAKECVCRSFQIKIYRDKLSGPMMDRIDMHVTCFAVEIARLGEKFNQEPSVLIQKRVQKARDIQFDRFCNIPDIFCNAGISIENIDKHCSLDEKAASFMKRAGLRLLLSARAYHKVIKVARTIADLENSAGIKINHLAEALQYRFSEFM